MQFVALCVHEGASGAETEGDGISGVDEKKIFEGINVLTEKTRNRRVLTQPTYFNYIK